MSSDNIGLGFYNENGIAFQTEGKHIIENVKRILTTRRGERIGNLSFGSDVSKYLFMPDLTIDDLITEIVNSIKRCEPRVIVEECSLSSKKDFDTVVIDLKLRLKSSGEEIETSVENISKMIENLPKDKLELISKSIVWNQMPALGAIAAPAKHEEVIAGA